jgi:quercetin dioxygenase-like cupin family protein
MRGTQMQAGLSSVAFLALVAVASAQQAGTFKRSELQRTDLSASGREAVMVVAEIPPGAASGRHTHPGEELAYVLEGTIVLEVAGKNLRSRSKPVSRS